MVESATGLVKRCVRAHAPDSINGISWSKNGEKLATVGDDRTAKVWGGMHGEGGHSLLHTLVGHTDKVRSVSLSGDGGVVVTGSDDFTVMVWDISSAQGTCMHTCRGHSSHVWSVALSRDATTMVSGGEP